MSKLKLKPLQWRWLNNEWVARTIVGYYSVYYVGAWCADGNSKHIFTAPHHLDGSKDSAEATLCKQKCEEDLLNKIKEHLMECECPVSNDLFPDLEPSLSPKLRWLKKHNVTVERNPRIADDEEPWEAWQGGKVNALELQIKSFPGLDGPYFAAANTEEEALYKLAVANDWKLWNEEG